MILFAGKVALALHRAVVLALGLVQDDSHPFSRGEECGADVCHRAALPLPDHFHQGAHFDGPAAPVRAHPAAAAASGLWRDEEKQTEIAAVKTGIHVQITVVLSTEPKWRFSMFSPIK